MLFVLTRKTHRMTSTNPPESLSVTFSLTPADVRALVWAQILRRPSAMARLAFLLLLLVGACIYLSTIFSPHDPTLVPQVIGGVVGLGLWGLSMVRMFSTNVKMVRNIGGLDTRTFTITPEWNRQSMPGVGETTRPWSAVVEVVSNAKAITLYLNRFQALVVPRRAFRTEEEFDHLAQLLREYQSRASFQSGRESHGFQP